ncbi:MAG: acyl-CoA/acyl-ACP dehydrogenase [Chromatiales bacterium]|jgi:alkylation response protein AidB-like acyl-CoA dehydrogenase|nr:acyl-CoA/acyl-ACP dehydrogenase [Chromatiales bacterium]
MSFLLTEEQRLLRDSMRQMVEREIQPVLAAHDGEAPLPQEALRECLRACARQGLTSGRVPEAGGGSGMRMVDLGLCYEQLPGALVFGFLSQEVTVARVFSESSAEIKERYLRSMIDVDVITCTATTEPGAGSDPRSVKTRAIKTDEGWRVNGAKLWISNASVAEVANVTVSVGNDERGLARMMRLLIDKRLSPFEAREIPTLGLRQGHLGEMHFDDCLVPLENVMGQAGDAARILTLTWLGNRPLVGMAAVGMAQRAFDLALEYAGNREQFGKAIAGHQLIQGRLVDIEEAIITARLLCLHALAALDAGERANHISAMAKRYACAAAERAVSSAMHVFGGMGIARETGIEQLYRDVRMFAVPDGTYEILTLIAGRESTGVAAYRA